MSTFSAIVPGKVVNHGIISAETFADVDVIQTTPAHYPDFAAVTPKGKLDRQEITLASFTRKYGDVSDHYGYYYNPITYAISKLREARQHSMGFKRLTNNYARGRVVWGVCVFNVDELPDYERNDDGSYKVDGDGIKIPKAEKTTGVFVVPGHLKVEPKYFNDDADVNNNFIAPIDVAITTGNDDLKTGTAGTFYPLATFVSGIGDYYKNMYLGVGHSSSADWDAIERFVTVNGAFPFQMIIGERSESGYNNDFATQNGNVISNFTLYDVKDEDSEEQYGLRRGLGAYTGANINRPDQIVDAPFDTVTPYQRNIDLVCGLLYDAEYTTGGEKLPNITATRLPAQAIMNPVDFKNESGVPYRHIVLAEDVVVESNIQNATFASKQTGLNARMTVTGCLDPFLTVEGTYPDAPTDWDADKNGDWVLTPTIKDTPSKAQFWSMTQDLVEGYYNSYFSNKSFTDVIRNRTSFLWDVGYRKTITNLFFQATEKRKDIIVIGCATIYGDKNTTDSIYARSKTLHSKAIQYPESEDYNAPATRISINMWDAYYIDEPTFDKFSLNIDLMCAFADAGGSQDGRITKSKLPDSKKGAVLRIAHTPSVGYEDDIPAAENLVNGCITVRPYNKTQWKRPAHPTVYAVTDSVLKDLPNVWYGVVIEKILQDQWIIVCGQTMPASSYLSTVRDNADSQIHNLIGDCLSKWTVETYFREDNPNSRSRMYTRVTYWVGKAKYMMDAVLYARNEEELETEENT